MAELEDLLNAINCKASKWYVIGLNLDLSPDELEAIERDEQTVEDCLRKMLKKCLSGKKNPPLTWTSLVRALRQPSLGEEVLASELEKCYLRNDCSNNDITPSLVVDKSISLLEEKYQTIGQKLARDLRQNKVTVDDLHIYAATLPLSVSKQYKKLKKCPSPLTKVTNIIDFIATINTNSNILHPDLLKDAVKQFGDEETKQLMAEYMEELCAFQRTTRLKDLMGKWSRETPSCYHRLELMMGDGWKEKTLAELDDRIKHNGWLLEMVAEGSIVLVFSTPELVDLEDDSFKMFLQSCEEVISVRVDDSLLPKASLKCKIGDLKAKLNEVLTNFRQKLIQSEVTKENLDAYFDQLHWTVHQHYKALMNFPPSPSAEAGTSRHVAIDCFIDALATYQSTVLNPSMLIEAISVLGDSETFDQMEIYLNNLEKFQKSTKVVDLIDIWNEEVPPDHRKVTIEMPLSADELTLYEIVQNLATIKSFVCHLISVKHEKDCLKIVLSLQQPVSFSSAVQQFLHHLGVIRIVLEDGSVIDLKAPQVDMSVEEDAFILPQIVQFGFHPVTGRNILLSENLLEAERKDENNDYYSSVYSTAPMNGTAEFEVKITKLKPGGFGGTLKIGIKWWKSGAKILEENIPRSTIEGDDFCMLYYDEIWKKINGDLQKKRYHSVSLNEIEQGGRVGMRLTSCGDLFFTINGRNLGLVANNVYMDGFDVYPVLDINRRCLAVKITRAVVRSGDFTLQELCIEGIARAVKSSEEVKELPLPFELKLKVEKYMH